MRILLVLDRVENPASANALMGFRLAEQLLRRDHTVHILTLWDGLHTPPAPPEGAMQHLLAFADERQMNEALENGQKGGTPVPLTEDPANFTQPQAPEEYDGPGAEAAPPHRGQSAGNRAAGRGISL